MLTIQSKEGVILAYLNNLENAKVKETLNGEYIITLLATIEPLKTEFLYDNENLIEYQNDLFRVVKLEEIHNEENMITVAIIAEHISYDLIKNTMLNFNHLNQSASFVMNRCLNGTDFRCIYTDITDFKTDIQYTQECNSKQISMAIAHNWKGELEYHRYDIKLLKQRGENRGVDFRFGKNLSSIKRIQNFAESTIAYDISVQQGSELEELGYFELGDTVRVIDDALNIDIEVRIIDLEKDILTGVNSKVVLGNEIKNLRSSFNGISKAVKDIDDIKQVVDSNAPNWDKINDIISENGNVIADKIAGTMNTANATIQNTTGTMSWTGNTLIFHDQPKESDSNWIVECGAGGIRIADNRNKDGSWDWATALTGRGINASEINTGEINAVNIRGVDILGSTFTGGTINGVTINGATIYVGDRTNGNYIELSPNNPIKVLKNNILVSSLGYSGVGGGNLTIYDVGGQEAFKVECLENGNLRLYGNDTPGFIPDPDHPGFVIPNPNPRSMEIKSGRVIFEGGSAGVMRSKYFRRFVDVEDLAIKCSPRFHTHETGFSSGHTHSVNQSYDIVDMS